MPLNPELREKAKVTEDWEKAADLNKDGIVDRYEVMQWNKLHKNGALPAGKALKDLDNNPPGPKGGPGNN